MLAFSAPQNEKCEYGSLKMPSKLPANTAAWLVAMHLSSLRQEKPRNVLLLLRVSFGLKH